MKKRKKFKEILKTNYDSSGYPVNEEQKISDQNNNCNCGQINLQDLRIGATGNTQTDYNTNKNSGYSTDIEQLARSKKLFAIENKWR
jgi:hypothetical protein